MISPSGGCTLEPENIVYKNRAGAKIYDFFLGTCLSCTPRCGSRTSLKYRVSSLPITHNIILLSIHGWNKFGRLNQYLSYPKNWAFATWDTRHTFSACRLLIAIVNSNTQRFSSPCHFGECPNRHISMDLDCQRVKDNNNVVTLPSLLRALDFMQAVIILHDCARIKFLVIDNAGYGQRNNLVWYSLHGYVMKNFWTGGKRPRQKRKGCVRLFGKCRRAPSVRLLNNYTQ